MKRHSLWGLLLIPIYAVMLVGWTPSLHPLYTEEDIVFDPALLGIWQQEGENFSMEISPSDQVNQAYVISCTDGLGNRGSFLAHLVKIGDYYFLDLFPPEREDYAYAGLLTVDAHAFMLVVQIRPDLMLRNMDDEWLHQYLEDNPGALGYIEGVSVDCSNRVTTASTEELQAFMTEHVNTEGAYLDPMVFHRVEGATDTGEGESPSGEN